MQDDWHTPTRSAWVARLEETVLEQPGPVVIVAHSLGCITTAHMNPKPQRGCVAPCWWRLPTPSAARC